MVSTNSIWYQIMDTNKITDNLTGILPVLPTPFLANNHIDAYSMKKVVRFALQFEVGGLVFPGFASEVELLTVQERVELLEVIFDEVQGKVPMVVGASATNIKEVIEHGRIAAGLGIHHLMVQPPKNLAVEAAKSFMQKVGLALPKASIILQNAPEPRGANFSPSQILDLVNSVPQITYVKEETVPAGPSITQILANKPPHLVGVIGGGGARYLLDEYKRGACAAMPAIEIIDLHVAIDQAWRKGERQKSRSLYVQSLPLLVLQAAYRMRLTKHVLKRRGVLQNSVVRAPVPDLDATAVQEIDENISALDLTKYTPPEPKVDAADAITRVEVYTLKIPRTTPYLGEPRLGEEPNEQGYFVRQGNRTVYPIFDRSVLVRLETRQGFVGWGETYGLVAPGAVGEIIKDLLSGFIIGRDPSDPTVVFDNLYNLMRFRGYTGGFYVDALAAIDIALWDIAGKKMRKPLADLLGGVHRKTIPAYVSGLPEKTCAKRVELAKSWAERGFSAFKFATPVADDGAKAEMQALRTALGPNALIAVDMHWAQSAEDALTLIQGMAPFDIWFAEAPVCTEDIAALEKVTRLCNQKIAVGEEWRTVWDMKQRIDRCPISIVQPEMGHKGVTSFMRIGALAAERGIQVIPHATIGAGIFLAASLQASAALPAVSSHEFQHSVFEPNRKLLKKSLECNQGAYLLPPGYGLGVEFTEETLSLLQPLG